MFAIFTKLTRDEEMPRLEELRSRSLPFPRWCKRAARLGRKGQTATGAGATGAPGARQLTRPQHTAPTLSPPRACAPKSQILVYQQLLGVDLAASRPDYLAVHGYKWMLCPRGAAWLVTPRHEELRPLMPSWKSANDDGYFGGTLRLAAGAARCDASPAP